MTLSNGQARMSLRCSSPGNRQAAAERLQLSPRTARGGSTNSAVRAMLIMYVKCVSGRAEEPQPRLKISLTSARRITGG
jgi:hypothetical protein